MVDSLARQAANFDKDEYEIVCIDDHSSEHYLAQNEGISKIANYIKLDENVGRARIRNMFLKYAKGEYLLFLDCDSLVPEKFLQGYADTLISEPTMVVGGRVYDETFNDREHRLSYLYGIRMESRPLKARIKAPYRSFMTNNFMVRRDVLECIRFDENITKYGHEDTIFGYRLEQNHIPILHIENAVINGVVEENAEFLRKSVEAVENLAEIYKNMHEDPNFCQSVKLLKAYERVKSMGMTWLVYNMFKTFKKQMEHRFVKGKINLKQFSFYKLGVFIETFDKKQKP